MSGPVAVYFQPTAEDSGVSSLPQISVQWLPWLECDADYAVATKETHAVGSLRPGAQPLQYQRLVSRCDLHSGAMVNTSCAKAGQHASLKHHSHKQCIVES